MCNIHTILVLNELFLSHKKIIQGIKSFMGNVLAFLFCCFVGGLVYGSVVIQALPLLSKRSDKELIITECSRNRGFHNLSFILGICYSSAEFAILC